MSPLLTSGIIAAYFIILFTVSYIAGRKADNQGFFVGNRKSSGSADFPGWWNGDFRNIA